MISVIVPIYNAEKYLRECLDSIVDQTYKDIEVLMVNDGSTDGSEMICCEYENEYDNFHLINKENGGQMSAWILGVQKSHGDLLGFVDSDDKISPTMYAEMMERYESTGADIVMCNFYDWDTRAATPRHDKKLQGYYGEKDIHKIYEMVFPTMTSYFSVSRWDKLFKRDLYVDCMNRYCDYVVRTFEDRFIVIPYIFSCKSFAFVDKPLYYWRRRKMSSSRKPRMELCDIMENLFIRQKKMLEDRDIYQTYRDNLEIGKMDLMRLIFYRNLCGQTAIFDKFKIAEKLLTPENCRIVVCHKDACAGKFGRYLYICCKLHSRSLLVLGAKMIQMTQTADDGLAFE